MKLRGRVLPLLKILREAALVLRGHSHAGGSALLAVEFPITGLHEHPGIPASSVFCQDDVLPRVRR